MKRILSVLTLLCATLFAQAQYCTPSITNPGPTGGNEFISNVTFGTINNTSGGGAYSDFSSISTTVVPGTATAGTITVTNFFTSDRGYIWVDLNNDFDFTDPGEQFGNNLPNTAGVINFSVNLPVGTAPGSYRMRIGMVWNQTTVDPCGSYGWGEFEDYTLTVGAPAVLCTPAPNTTGDCSFGYYISQFTLNTINNASPNCTSNYEDFSSISTTLVAGNTYGAGITIEGFLLNDVMDMWIDYNNDLDFNDAGEYVITNIVNTGGISASSFVVPPGTSAGNKRLRVVCRNNIDDPTPDPCGPLFAGQFEDYTVTIATYCTPTVTNNTSTINERIANFTLGTINNTSTGTAAYENFTNLSTTLTPGAPNAVSMIIGPNSYSSDVVDIWVDLNGDADFIDAGELVVNGQPITYNGVNTAQPSPASASFTIPLATPIGAYRLRVAVRDAGFNSTANPCALAWGQFEDYTILVGPPPSCAQPTTVSVSNVTTTDAQINWTLVPGAVSYNVYIGSSPQTVAFLGNFANPTNAAIAAGLNAQTNYTVGVYTICAGGLESDTTFTTFNTSCFDCPLGAQVEAEACGTSANDGCLVNDPLAVEAITVGTPVCGTSFSTGTTLGQFDEDYYEFTIANSATVEFNFQGDFPPLIGFIDPLLGCGFPEFIAGQAVFLNTGSCIDTSFTLNLCAGTYWAYVANGATTGFPCGTSSNYTITINELPLAQGPVNDDVCNASALPVGSTCTPTAGTNVNATYCASDPNADILGGGCWFGGAASFQSQDVWYYVVVPATGNVEIRTSAGTTTDAIMAVYAGSDCSNLNFVACNDDSNGLMPELQISGQTPGDTLWIQIANWSGGTGTFDICALNCDVIPNGTPEIEACGDTITDGCNLLSPLYQNLSCNESVTGTSFFDGTIRDTDWYSFNITTTTSVSWTVEAEFPVQAAIVEVSDCNITFADVIANVNGASCDQVVASAVLGPGNYAFFVSPFVFLGDPAIACAAEYNATLNVSSPDASIAGPTTLCVTDAPFNYTSFNPGGTWSGDGIIDAFNGTYDASAAGVGIDTVVYEIIQNTCSTSDTIIVTVGDVPSAGTTPVGLTQLCFNPNNGTYTTVAIPDADSYTFILTPSSAGNVTVAGNVATIDWDDNYSGTASLVAAGVNECGTGQFSQSLDIVIEGVVAVAATPVGPAVVCQGTATTNYVTPGATNATSYIWAILPLSAGSVSGTGTGAVVTWNPSFTGQATIGVVGVNTCDTSNTPATIVVDVQVPGTSTIAAVAPLCQTAGTVQLVGTPSGGTFSGGAYVSPSGVFNPSLAQVGLNTVTYTTTGGCVTPAVIQIQVDGVPVQGTAPVGLTEICQDGATFNVFAPPITGSTSFTWSFTPDPSAGAFTTNGNIGTVDLAPNFCGEISIIVSGNNQCGQGLFSLPLLIDVTCTPAPVIAPAGPFCASNTELTMTSDIAGFWGINSGSCVTSNGPATIGTINPSICGPGTYTVSVTAIDNGCAGTGTRDITIVPELILGINIPSAVCLDAGTVTLTGNPAGGTWAATPGSITNAGVLTLPTNGADVNVSYTITNGTNGCDGQATATVNVTDAPEAQYSFAQETPLGLVFSDESTNATSWFWSFGDNLFSNDQNPAHNYFVEGEYTVCLTVSNICGQDSICYDIVVTKVGVEEDMVNGINLYPNPTNGNVTVDFTTTATHNYTMNITDLTGKVIYTENLANFNGAFKKDVDMTGLASGMYFFRLSDETGRASHIKIVRQ